MNLATSAILSLILLAGNANAGSIMVIGDSFSAAFNSWVNLYRDRPGNRTKILAQSGRAVIDYALPRDISPIFGISRVYYMLGSNDIGRGVWPGSTLFYLNTHLGELVRRNFKVTLVLPPVFPEYEDASHATRAVMIPWCARVRCIDLAEIWDSVPLLVDNHPTDAGQQIILDFIDP
jgi:hypothetical protein